MKYIFNIYNNDLNGIIEVEAPNDQKAIEIVNNLGLKFNSMQPSICVYKIQYTSVNTKKWNL
jgi:hypothetical protein